MRRTYVRYSRITGGYVCYVVVELEDGLVESTKGPLWCQVFKSVASAQAKVARHEKELGLL